jgi:hypothetical protein
MGEQNADGDACRKQKAAAQPPLLPAKHRRCDLAKKQ